MKASHLWFGLPAVVAALVVGVALTVGCSGRSASEPSSPSSLAGLWCEEHGVPEDKCTLCHPELKDKLLWCEEHDCPEEVCTLCHPELKEKIKTCEHGLPAAYCKECSPGSV